MPRELSPLQNDISPCCKLVGDVFGFAINPQSNILLNCLFTYFMMLSYVGNSSTNKTLIRHQRIFFLFPLSHKGTFMLYWKQTLELTILKIELQVSMSNVTLHTSVLISETTFVNTGPSKTDWFHGVRARSASPLSVHADAPGAAVSHGQKW